MLSLSDVETFLQIQEDSLLFLGGLAAALSVNTECFELIISSVARKLSLRQRARGFIADWFGVTAQGARPPAAKGGEMNLEFGYSPCPNDTFMFWAWAHRRLASEIELWPHLADIQQLNRLALDSGGHLPLTKVSASTYLQPQVRQRYQLLNVGGALGRGCGPLIVSRQPWGEADPPSGLRLAVPGLDTTACRLARTALGRRVGEWVELRYDKIMPAVLEGRVDAGVIIHESRFTYRGLGLHLAFDLGVWWEKRTGLPLPLGVMLASRNLAETRVKQVESALRASIERAWSVFRATAEPESQALWSYLRENAIELDDTTIASHIELYVNDFSLELGAEGHAALARFEELARS